MEHTFQRSSMPLSMGTGSIAAILSRTEHGNLHAGLVYRWGGRIEILHLAWQDRLANDWHWGGVWATPTVIPEKLLLAAAWCRRIWKAYERDNKFPYGLAYRGTSFDDEGRLVLGFGAHGLTCATLILSIFTKVGVPLIDEDSWPVRKSEDEEFLRFVLPYASASHKEILQREVDQGVRRIWPDEVLGACMVDVLPVSFQSARTAADTILVLLREVCD